MAALSDEDLVERDGVFLDDMSSELRRARKKFPEQDVWVTLAALGEEFGELCKDVLHFNFEPHKGKSEQSIRAEAIQVAVMAMRVALDCPLRPTKRAPHE